MKRASKLLIFYSAFFFLLLLGACSEKETELGLNLVDPATIYNGKTATLTIDTAFSLRDDSLRTSGYSFCIIGNRSNTLFGKVSSDLYTQIGIAAGMNSIDLNEVDIDSVVLSLVIDELFPDTGATYSFHFEVMQLAEMVDTVIYYSTDVLPVNTDRVFFNQTVTVGALDTVVNLKLDPGIKDILNQSGTGEEFSAQAKGLRIRIVDDADEGMLTLNLAALQTCLTAHYHYGTDTTAMSYKFLVGTGVQHFTHFSHDYSGSEISTVTHDGAQRLYLEPLGGYNARLSIDRQIKAFHEAHPLAVIHHAELLMPVVATDNGAPLPDQVIVLRCTDSTEVAIPDQYDSYTYHGYDGTYDAGRNLYRARVTEHIQRLLREGYDPGMLLTLNSRRSSARQAVIAGSNAANPVRIEIVYSE